MDTLQPSSRQRQKTEQNIFMLRVFASYEPNINLSPFSTWLNCNKIYMSFFPAAFRSWPMITKRFKILGKQCHWRRCCLFLCNDDMLVVGKSFTLRVASLHWIIISLSSIKGKKLWQRLLIAAGSFAIFFNLSHYKMTRIGFEITVFENLNRSHRHNPERTLRPEAVGFVEFHWRVRHITFSSALIFSFALIVNWESSKVLPLKVSNDKSFNGYRNKLRTRLVAEKSSNSKSASNLKCLDFRSLDSFDRSNGRSYPNCIQHQANRTISWLPHQCVLRLRCSANQEDHPLQRASLDSFKVCFVIMFLRHFWVYQTTIVNISSQVCSIASQQNSRASLLFHDRHWQEPQQHWTNQTTVELQFREESWADRGAACSGHVSG